MFSAYFFIILSSSNITKHRKHYSQLQNEKLGRIVKSLIAADGLIQLSFIFFCDDAY